MLRRFLTLPAVLLLVSGLASALDGSHYLEAGALVSVYNEERGNVYAPGGAVGWYYDCLFSIQGDDIGVGIWAGLGFPQLRNGFAGQVFHVLAGPIFTAHQGERLTIPLGIGCYLNMAASADESTLGAGVGASIAFQWRFSQGEYIYGRMQGAWTFHGRGEMVITPSIGFGFTLGNGSGRKQEATGMRNEEAESSGNEEAGSNRNEE